MENNEIMDKPMTNREVRQAKNDRYQEILTIMLYALKELVQGDELSGESKLTAVKMLDTVRHELHIDHRV